MRSLGNWRFSDDHILQSIFVRFLSGSESVGDVRVCNRPRSWIIPIFEPRLVVDLVPVEFLVPLNFWFVWVCRKRGVFGQKCGVLPQIPPLLVLLPLKLLYYFSFLWYHGLLDACREPKHFRGLLISLVGGKRAIKCGLLALIDIQYLWRHFKGLVYLVLLHFILHDKLSWFPDVLLLIMGHSWRKLEWFPRSLVMEGVNGYSIDGFSLFGSVDLSFVLGVFLYHRRLLFGKRLVGAINWVVWHLSLIDLSVWLRSDWLQVFIRKQIRTVVFVVIILRPKVPIIQRWFFLKVLLLVERHLVRWVQRHRLLCFFNYSLVISQPLGLFTLVIRYLNVTVVNYFRNVYSEFRIIWFNHRLQVCLLKELRFWRVRLDLLHPFCLLSL